MKDIHLSLGQALLCVIVVLVVLGLIRLFTGKG